MITNNFYITTAVHNATVGVKPKDARHEKTDLKVFVIVIPKE